MSAAPDTTTATRLTQSQIAQALHKVSDLMASGMPLAAVYVAEHGVTILASELGALRWRERCGDTVAGHPLTVVAVNPIGETR